MPDPVEEDVGVIDSIDVRITTAGPVARPSQGLNFTCGIIYLEQ